MTAHIVAPIDNFDLVTQAAPLYQLAHITFIIALADYSEPEVDLDPGDGLDEQVNSCASDHPAHI